MAKKKEKKINQVAEAKAVEEKKAEAPVVEKKEPVQKPGNKVERNIIGEERIYD